MDEEYIKDFAGWLPVKEKINDEENAPTFKEREIWWCSAGVNVGVEIDGKNHLYERPVIIVRKFSKRLFWGVPTTTQLKDFPHYHPVFYASDKDMKSKERRAILSQMRPYDSLRLSRPIGRLGHQQFNEMVAELMKLFRV